jgi:hypothetical protein
LGPHHIEGPGGFVDAFNREVDLFAPNGGREQSFGVHDGGVDVKGLSQ